MNAHHPPGADSLAAYVFQASTQNLRGLGCSFVEKAQLAAWRASDDQKRDVTLSAYRHPHRLCLLLTVVRSQCYELLKAAGLGTSSLKFSDYIQTTYMVVDLRVNRKRPWACLGGVPHGLYLLGRCATVTSTEPPWCAMRPASCSATWRTSCVHTSTTPSVLRCRGVTLTHSWLLLGLRRPALSGRNEIVSLSGLDSFGS